MEPNSNFSDRLNEQSLPGHEHETEIFRDRRESEDRDRAMVREAVERGLPETEVEEQVLITSDFVWLNPGQDVRAYVRRLVDEEKGDLHGSSDQAASFREGPPDPAKSNPTDRPAQSQTHAPGIKSRTIEAEAMARDYINENFKHDDWLAIVAINRKSGETLQRISRARNIVGPDYQRWLRHLNATGSDVYMSLNTFKDHARGRTKEDLKEIRHLYLDLDEGGAGKLEAIRQDSAIPKPNYVLNTSPGKFQVIWRVEGVGRDQAEAMLRTLAQRFGGDPAATDSTRVFRLPGFNNKKYEQDIQVTLKHEAPAVQVYTVEDFKLYEQDREAGNPEPAAQQAHRRSNGEAASQSEKDWQYAIRKLKAGEDPEQIIRAMARYRSKDLYDKNDSTRLIAPAKPKPRYYAEHTVARAMAHLGISKRPEAHENAATSSRESETAPSR